MTVSGNTLTANYLAAGNYQIKLHSNLYGFASVSNSIVTINFASNPTATPITSSFIGGKELLISGPGFLTDDPKNNEITVCGLRSKIVSAT